jgi:hypothetical protein
MRNEHLHECRATLRTPLSTLESMCSSESKTQASTTSTSGKTKQNLSIKPFLESANAESRSNVAYKLYVKPHKFLRKKRVTIKILYCQKPLERDSHHNGQEYIIVQSIDGTRNRLSRTNCQNGPEGKKRERERAHVN